MRAFLLAILISVWLSSACETEPPAPTPDSQVSAPAEADQEPAAPRSAANRPTDLPVLPDEEPVEQPAGEEDEAVDAPSVIDPETDPVLTQPVPDLPVRKSALAGSWYTPDPVALRSELESFLEAANPPKPRGPVRKAISPHAGYRYSGSTAAEHFRVMRDQPQRFHRIIVLAPSHTTAFRGASIPEVKGYETPLGLALLDHAAIAQLRQSDLIQAHPTAHLREHAIEIQLNWLHAIYDENWRLVPILIGRLGEGDPARLTEAIRPLIDDQTLVIASSDFTHYGSRFRYHPFPLTDRTPGQLRELDMGAVKEIQRKSFDGWMAYRQETKITVCGHLPIAVLLRLLKEDEQPVLLKYETSGNLLGDYSNSVSYVSMIFAEPAPERKREIPTEHLLSGAEQQTLLRIARDTLDTYFASRDRLKVDEEKYELTDKMRRPTGAFVTLEKKGSLRGCIGNLQPAKPLVDAVIDNAIKAAVADRRFQPVTAGELDDIHIEISVLSPVQPVESADEIVLGRDGIIFEHGRRRSTFLPQVAPEQGWDLPTTLNYLSRKAGLPADTWKDPATKLSIYQAQVFEEEQPHF